MSLSFVKTVEIRGVAAGRLLSTRVNIAAPSFFKAPTAVSDKPLVFTARPEGLPPPAKPVQVRGRYGLPGAKHPLTNPRLPATLANPRPTFPALLATGDGCTPAAASDDPSKWAVALKDQLDTLLPKHGAVVVQGFEKCLHGAAPYSRFMEALKAAYDCRHFMEGRSMTSTAVASMVRTGSDDHPAYTIEPHNEFMVAAAQRPRKLFLLCDVEPTDGGEWVITDADMLHKNLPPAIVEKFARLGTKYEIFYPPEGPGVYNHWQENIAPTKEAAELYLKRSGCEWEWDHAGVKDSLLIHRVLPALATHPDELAALGDKAPLRWFNQIQAHHRTFYQDCHPDFEHQTEGPWPVHTKYGDGTEIEDETLAELRRCAWEASVAVPMTKGTLLCVDNYRALHGRISFTPGTPRRSLVSIIYA